MENLVVILIVLSISSVISILWANGIDKMHKKYPNYRGEDFLNWDGKNPWNDITKTAGRDGWDDNHIHSEGDF